MHSNEAALPPSLPRAVEQERDVSGSGLRSAGVTLWRCPNCRLVVVPHWGLRWSCDDWHPEVLCWLEAGSQAEQETF